MKTIASLILFFYLQSAQAFPIGSLSHPSVVRLDQDWESYPFNGIVDFPSCSASIIQLKGQTREMRALLMTNGHCTNLGSTFALGIRMPAAGEFLHNIKQSVTVTLLNPEGKDLAMLKTTRLIFGTMTMTDIALYELAETYEEIENTYGVHPLILAETPARIGEKIDLISGRWRAGSSCKVEMVVHKLKEEQWTFNGSYRYDDLSCKVYGGTSGSPIVSTDRNEVVGINNTAYEGGNPCSLMNPCEVNPSGKISTARKGIGYAQMTHALYTCLNADGTFDFKKSSCELKKPHSK